MDKLPHNSINKLLNRMDTGMLRAFICLTILIYPILFLCAAVQSTDGILVQWILELLIIISLSYVAGRGLLNFNTKMQKILALCSLIPVLLFAYGWGYDDFYLGPEGGIPYILDAVFLTFPIIMLLTICISTLTSIFRKIKFNTWAIKATWIAAGWGFVSSLPYLRYTGNEFPWFTRILTSPGWLYFQVAPKRFDYEEIFNGPTVANFYDIQFRPAFTFLVPALIALAFTILILLPFARTKNNESAATEELI